MLDKPGTHTFSPGIHEFRDQFKIEGSGVNVVAENVLWLFGPGSSANWGSGPNSIRVSARPSSVYYGDNVSAGTVSSGGGVIDSSSGVTGGIYLPSAELLVRGNTGSGLCAEGAPVVAYRVQIQETGFVQGATDGSSGTTTRVTHLAD